MRFVIGMVLLGFASAAGAQPPPPPSPKLPERGLDPTLERCLQGSNHVLVGEVVADPVKRDRLFTYQTEKDPRGIYACRIKVLEGLHDAGYFPVGREMTIIVARWPEPGEPDPAGVRKRGKYVFFLNWAYGTEGPHTADPWFGVQPYNSTMVGLLRRMGNRPPG